MIEEVGIITSVDRQDNKQIVVVQTQIKSTCGSCEAQGNCGTGALAKFFARKHEKMSFHYDSAVKVGQKVKLGIPEEKLVKASILIYMLPLFSLIISALLAQMILPSIGVNAEGGIILSALVSTIVTFKWVSAHLKRPNSEKFCPKIISVIPPQTEQINVKQIYN